METDTNVFSGLEDLGFEELSNMEIYKKDEEEKYDINTKKEETLKIKENMLLYDKRMVCPVCASNFTTRTVKTSGYRMKKKESDFYIKYDGINPYFYDVCMCNVCGYASMKVDFNKLMEFEIKRIQKTITPKWQGRKYPEIYDIDIAIERYKVSLLSYTVIDAKASKKAMNCLKLAWLYRELGDTKNEEKFIEQALIGFKKAYLNEQFPIYGMHENTIKYLIGELSRRLCKYDEALKYFSEVITSQKTNIKVKDLATDQKNLIKETLKKDEENVIEDVVKNTKKGLFSRLFSF